MVLHPLSSLQAGLWLQVNLEEKPAFSEHSLQRKFDGNRDALPGKLHFKFRGELAGHQASFQFDDTSHGRVLRKLIQ